MGLLNDPYAAFRRLPKSQFTWQEATGETIDNSGYDPRVTPAAVAGWGGSLGLEGTPFQSKYGGRLTDLGGGRVGVTMQQPGAHKYDTMTAAYAPDPVTGEWVLQGDPMDSKTREVSSGEQFRDNVELAGKGVLAAGALYGAGLGLSSGVGALGGGSSAGAGGAGAGAGAAASNPAVWNAALAESAVGTGGYGASSAGLGGGATASWGAGAGYGADAAAGLPDGSFWGDIGRQGSADVMQTGADPSAGSLQTMGTMEPITVPEVPAGPTGTVNGGNGLLGKAAETAAGTAVSQAGGSNYSNEGGNYPTSGSTQGAGGSPANASGAADWLESLKSYGGTAADWLKANPQAGKTLAGLLGGAAGVSGGGGGGGYVDSGYRPTISRGGFMTSVAPQAQPAQPKPSGLLNMPQGQGYANSGLWRYGLLGGGK